MSSLHQDRLLVEGSEPVTGTATTLPTARGTSRRAVGSTEKQATSKVPTQRPGTAQRIGTTQSTTATPAAPRAKRAAGAKAAAVTGTLASRAKAATVKAATAKAATAKVVTAKAATAARAAAVSTVANRTAGVRSARAAAAAEPMPAAKTRATKPAVKPAPAGKAATPAKAAPAVKPAAAKSAEAKPAVAKTVAEKAPVAKTAPVSKPAPVKPAAAKPGPAAKPAVATPSRTEATSTDAAAADAAPRVRPTPHKRVPAQAAVAESVPLADVADLGAPDTADVVVVGKDVVAGSERASGARLPLFLRRRPPMVGNRPSLYLAAALVGAISLSAFSTVEPAAQATTTVSQSASVAEQLGIEAAPTDAVVDADTTERLGELAVSRNTREAEQAAAIQVQAEADRIAVEAAAEAARPKAVFPIAGARLTSPFGPRWGTLHAGLDLAAPMLTPEYAAMDGVVLEAGPASGFGLAVYIQHENGDVTVYGHMEKILVEAGQVVGAGDTIALVGNRGQSTGPHLHFEVHQGGLDGQKIDPMAWLRERGVEMG